MPPTSYMRKASFIGNHPIDATNTTTTTAARRTASGRAIRNNTTRPANYYARPFDSALTASNDRHESQDSAMAPEPGFFPALQFLSDAMTALPREVIRHFTLLKEVEAKTHGPSETVGELADALMELPIPTRRVNGTTRGAQQGGIFSFTASNSAAGSANASLINGAVGGLSSAKNSVVGSQIGEEETEEEPARRRKYLDLRVTLHNLLPNLDERNAMLSEVNRVLDLQLLRVDSVIPHVDKEISEEARLGSMAHWAYSDNRQKKVPTSTTAATRRDVAATHNLAAAAHAVHETDIAQARLGRDTVKEKHKGKRQEHVDSDFDDRPVKKAQGKGVKGKAAAALGISANGEPVKRRKVEKGLGVAPAMERSVSGTTLKASKNSRETPRSTPADEPSKKANKPKPAPPQPRKRLPNSAQQSPVLASSPLHSTFNAGGMEPPPVTRPQSGRIRQNSSIILRHERLADEASSRPTSAGKTNGNGDIKTNGKRKAPQDEEEALADGADGEHPVEETTEGVTGEDVEMANVAADQQPPAPLRSSSSKGGLASKTGTPRTENFPELGQTMTRTRSTRSTRNNTTGDSSASDEPGSQGTGGEGRRTHKRQPSNSHLIKQLAPFNRSPDIDRHRNLDDEDHPDGIGGGMAQGNDASIVEEGRRTRSRPVSRRNTQTKVAAPPSEPQDVDEQPKREQTADEGRGVEDAAPAPEANTPGVAVDEDEDDLPEVHHDPEIDDPPAPDLEADYEGAEDEELEDDEEGSEHDPDDPNEPKYCYCNRGSYGEMVACDNSNCPREWFHIGCTELKAAPEEHETWYCKECRPQFVGGRKRAKGGGNGGGGGNSKGK